MTGRAAQAAVTVIGWDGSPLAEEARAVIAGAVRVAGAARLLDAARLPPGKDPIVIEQLAPALDEICAGPWPVAVLASGDPGFFGIVRALRERGIEPRVLPAVSSVSTAFARLGLTWDDALVLSMHGRDVRPVRAAALAHPKVAVLTAPGAGAARLAGELVQAGRDVYVAERLGSDAERVTALDRPPAGELADPNVLIAIDPGRARCGQGPGWLAGHQGAPPGWALPESEFEHRDSMITKAEVRALVLARLGPGPGRTIWDLGAGSGSVAIECARFSAEVVAIESDPGQCARIREGAAAHGVYVHVAEGRAPDALAGLPSPDAVFAGGGDDAALAAALNRGRPARAVVTLASVDRVAAVHRLLGELGYAPGGAQLQVSRIAGLPGGSLRLAGANPVFVLWGDRETAGERQ